MNRELSISSKSICPFYVNWLLVLLMIIIIVTSIIASYYCYLGEYDWLQRSGSLVVAIAVILEYMHVKVFNPVGTQGGILDGGLSFNGSKLIAKVYKSVWKANYFLLILGTLIWGYGDIPFWPKS
jgi:hypothetical protein